ncbi:MAG: hypothetical protein U0802_23440 [Candidatus Binatia bacterium]
MGGIVRRPPGGGLRPLTPGGHAVWELAPGLLLVFKPRGHREAIHAHPHGQRLRVLRGALEIRTARGVRRLAGERAGGAHRGRARARDPGAGRPWLIAERT